MADEATPNSTSEEDLTEALTQEKALNEALNLWTGGQHDQAIATVRPDADRGLLPAIVMSLWFHAQRAQLADAEAHIRYALQQGLVGPTLWFLDWAAGNPAYVSLAVEISDAAHDTGAWRPDFVGQWPSLWGSNRASVASGIATSRRRLVRWHTLLA